MIKTFIYKVLLRRHFWRDATFSEIAELYVSRAIRVVALNIVSGFTSVYLFQKGYSLVFIMAFWFCFYLFKTPLSFFAAFFVARFGPKHGILISNLLFVPSFVTLGFLPKLGIISIVVWGVFMAFSAAIYRLSYYVDFSKIKNSEHAGKELAYMNILEKVAIGVSPIIGGIIALLFGIESVMWLAAVLFVLSALPLFKSVEPTATHQIIKLNGFPWRANASNFLVQTGVGFDLVTTGIIWYLFIVVMIFDGQGSDIYVKLGFLSSVTIIIALASSYMYGKLIDKRRGGELLKFSVIGNSLVHVVRPFINTPISVAGVNFVNEAATTGYNMAFMRGMFDAADLSGHRIIYLSISDAISSLGSAMACLIFILCHNLIGSTNGFKMFFIIAAIYVLIIGLARFNLYKRKTFVIY